MSLSCSQSWDSLSDTVLPTRQPLRPQSHLPGTRTSTGHLGVVGTSRVLRAEIRPLAAAAAAAERRPVQLTVDHCPDGDEEHRE
jgi:hypothetical protein